MDAGPLTRRLRSGEAEPLVHQLEHWRRRLTRLVRADLEKPVEFADVRAELVVTRLDRGQDLDDRFRKVLLETAVARTLIPRLHVWDRAPRDDGHELDQVRDAGLLLWAVP